MSAVGPDLLDDDTAGPAPAGEVAAAPSSQLTSLRDRREQARKRAHLDLAVPGYDPPVYVRFRAVTPEVSERLQAMHDKAKATEKTLRICSAMLAEACVGVFEVDPDSGAEVSVDPDDREGRWPRFDERLAGLLGVEAGKAAAVVEALYVEKMHVLAVADELTRWSMAGDEELRRATQGE